MQKLFEDQLQKIQDDHSKRLTQLETEMMKGCEQNDLNHGLIQRLTDQVTLLEGRLNETQNQNQDLRDEIQHLKKSESVLERPRREVSRHETQNGVRNTADKKPVAFDAFRNQPFYEAQSTLTFNGTSVNIGGHFDPSNGQFTAPVAGIYSFSFHGLTYDGTATHIKIMKNGENVGGAYRRHEGEGDEEHESLKAGLKKAEGMLAQSLLLELKPQDKVAVFAYHGNLRDGAWHYTHFTGHLIH